MQAACTHLDQIRKVTPRTPQGCEECLKIGSQVGSPAAMPGVRSCWLLRLFAEHARDEALPSHEASHHAIVRAGGELGMVLRR